MLSRKYFVSLISTALLPVTAHVPAMASPAEKTDAMEWLAGDHHVHSEYSVKWREDPAHPNILPTPIKGGDARYPILLNAEMGRVFGLAWMVSTDHGGPGHDRVDTDMVYPNVVAARQAMPGFLLFYGMEFDTPGGEHSTLIIPQRPDEREKLRAIEAGFDERNAYPTDSTRDTKAKMLEALRFMAAMQDPPVIIANHPSRTATGPGKWGLHAPEEFRQWQDTAPNVAIGMEGSPGHQAAILGNREAGGIRGLYKGSPTLGGFDQMVAVLGGAWDSLLGEGRRWWITATSDSHVNWRDGGAEFWPGEYSKTYVKADDSYDGVLAGLRAGRIFAVTGDLITGISIRVSAPGTAAQDVPLGSDITLCANKPITVTIELTLPNKPNAAGQLPVLNHVDLISGDVRPVSYDEPPSSATQARVIERFHRGNWQHQQNSLVMEYRLPVLDKRVYLRLRGTNTNEDAPAPDAPAEDPWSDLWFYSNPVWLIPRRCE